MHTKNIQLLPHTTLLYLTLSTQDTQLNPHNG